ncbi:MAG: zinc ribbon domain-containing protein [Acidobacteriota bacterium]
MPESCTCGAQLPEDARFCHKCGKPQRDEPLLVDEPVEVVPEPVAVTAAVTPPVDLPITITNSAAVRAALPAGIAAFFLSAPLGAFGLLVLIFGGTLAVYLYRRRTGQSLSASNGMRLGLITGVFLFVMLLLSFTASIVLQPTFLDELQAEVTRRSALPEAEVRQVVTLLRTPLGIIAMLLGMFLSSTLPPALGGAVGAKLLGRH